MSDTGEETPAEKWIRERRAAEEARQRELEAQMEQERNARPAEE